MQKGATSPNFSRKLDSVTQTVAVIGFCGLVLVALLTFYDGAARYLSAPRLSGFSDYGELVYPIIIASCFPAVLLRQTNVTVRVLTHFVNFRTFAVFEFVAAILTLIFFTVLVWQFVEIAQKYSVANRTTRTVEMRLAPWWWMATMVMALCVPVQVYVCWAWLKSAVTNRMPDIKSLKSKEEYGEV